MKNLMKKIAEKNPRKSARDLKKGDMFRYQFTAGGRREAVELLADAFPVIDPASTVTVWVEIVRTGDHARVRLLPGTQIDVI